LSFDIHCKTESTEGGEKAGVSR